MPKIKPFHGDLHDYRTGKLLRPATAAEARASAKAAQTDHGVGVFMLDDKAVVVRRPASPGANKKTTTGKKTTKKASKKTTKKASKKTTKKASKKTTKAQ